MCNFLSSKLEIDANFNSLNPNRLYDSFNVEANFLKNIFSLLPNKNNCLNKNVQNYLTNNGICTYDNKYCYQDSICNICKVVNFVNNGNKRNIKYWLKN